MENVYDLFLLSSGGQNINSMRPVKLIINDVFRASCGHHIDQLYDNIILLIKKPENDQEWFLFRRLNDVFEEVASNMHCKMRVRRNSFTTINFYFFVDISVEEFIKFLKKSGIKIALLPE